LDFFDIVIFNESIYYAPDPLKMFDTYWRFVKPSGTIIVSIFDTGLRTAAIWRRLERRIPSTHSTRLSNELKQTWDVRVFIKIPEDYHARAATAASA
jgi:SAM-dependent methyltransferase